MRADTAQAVVLYGSSGHAAVLVDAIEASGKYVIRGYIDDTRPVGGDTLGYPVLGGIESLVDICRETRASGMVIAIGDNWGRCQVARKVESKLGKFWFPSIVHPSAVVARSATVGEGTVILAGVVVNSRVSIGRHCILNTSSSIDHDCRMGDFASVGPNSALGGDTNVGEYAAILLGASVIHKISIGEHAVVGAGAVVIRDVPAQVVAYGCPATVVRARQVGDTYL